MPDQGSNDEKEKEVLDLIDEKKPSRRERQRAKAAETKTVEDQKKEALDLGIEDEDAPKKSLVRKTEQSGKVQKPKISKLLEDETDPEFLGSGGGTPPPEEEDEKPSRRRRAKKSARMPARGRSKAGRRKG